MADELPAPDDREASEAVDDKRSGPQTIARAAMLLRMLARKGLEGTRLSDLKRMAGLPHPTIRRILIGLIEEGFIVQDENTRRYLLGPMNFELGLGALFKSDFQRAFHPFLEELSAESGDRVYLVMRSGADVVCLDRVEGRKDVRGTTFQIGGRRPLGFTAGGLAILSALSDAEITQILRINKRDIDNHARLTPASFRRSIASTRERGYALAKDIQTIGISHVGAATPLTRDGRIFAVSFTMESSELNPTRADDLFAMISRKFARIGNEFW